MPLYYFNPEGPGWSDYQDDDGIELRSDAQALIYAYQKIRVLKSDYNGSDRHLHLLVKNDARKAIFRVASIGFSALSNCAGRAPRLPLPAPTEQT